MTDIDLAAIKAERARLEATYITPGRPPTSARGIHHTALICSDVEETIKFYQGVLEFPLTVKRTCSTSEAGRPGNHR